MRDRRPTRAASAGRLDRRLHARPRLRRRRASLRLRPAQRGGLAAEPRAAAASRASPARASASRTIRWSIAARGCLYVSDSFARRQPGPGRLALRPRRAARAGSGGRRRCASPTAWRWRMTATRSSSSRPSAQQGQPDRHRRGRRPTGVRSTSSPASTACRTASRSTMRAISSSRSTRRRGILRVDRGGRLEVYVERSDGPSVLPPDQHRLRRGAALRRQSRALAHHRGRDRDHGDAAGRARDAEPRVMTAASGHHLGPSARLPAAGGDLARSRRSIRTSRSSWSRRPARLRRAAGRGAGRELRPPRHRPPVLRAGAGDRAACATCGRCFRPRSTRCWSSRASGRRRAPTTMAAGSGACRPTRPARSRAIARISWPRSVPSRRATAEGCWRSAGRRARAGKWLALPSVPSDAACLVATLSANLGPADPRGGRGDAAASTCSTRCSDYLAALRELCHPRAASMNPIATYDAMSRRRRDRLRAVRLRLRELFAARGREADPLHQRRRAGRGPGGGRDPRRRRLRHLGALRRDRRRGDLSHLAAPARAPGRRLCRARRPARACARPGPTRRSTARPGGFFSGTLETLDKTYVRPRFDGFIPAFEHMGEPGPCLAGRRGRPRRPDRFLQRRPMPAPARPRRGTIRRT